MKDSFRLGRCLNATTASVVLVSFLGIQFLAVLCFALLAVGYAKYNQISDVQRIYEIGEIVFMPVLLTASPVIGMVTVLLVAWKIAPDSLKDTSPDGAALVRGDWLNLITAFCVGLVVGAIASFVHGSFSLAEENRGGLIRMASGSWLTQVAWIIIGVVFHPLNEEILCRGVLFGGYRKSFGGVWAAVITTLLFLILHFPQGIVFPPLLVTTVVVSVVTLWFRLRAGAVGAAVAVHSGVNLIMTVLWYV